MASGLHILQSRQVIADTESVPWRCAHLRSIALGLAWEAEVQSEELTTAEECSLTPQMVTDKAAFFLLM
jgi:hypothetical protein